MDPHGHIYSDDHEKIPAEDKARLDGYLRARAEQDELAKLKGDIERLSKELTEREQ